MGKETHRNSKTHERRHGDINKCYSPKIVTTGKDDAPEEIETNGLTSASSMGLKEWQTNTNTMSFVVADGTTVIMAYQPECPYADPIEDTGSQVSCMAYMVDVNGKKGPNRVGKDIQLSSGVAFSTCDNPIGDMCWSTEFQANRAINTCDGSEYEDLDSYGSSNSWCDTNYWAGAKLSCQEKGLQSNTLATTTGPVRSPVRMTRTFGTSALRTVAGTATARPSATTALYVCRTKRLGLLVRSD